MLARGYPPTIDWLAAYVGQPLLEEHIRWFLYDQVHPDADVCGMDIPLHLCPLIPTQLRIKVFHSATSTYYAPSDLSGLGGMHRERIRATPHWKGGPGRYDCVYVAKHGGADGFAGLHVACVNLFFVSPSWKCVFLCTGGMVCHLQWSPLRRHRAVAGDARLWCERAVYVFCDPCGHNSSFGSSYWRGGFWNATHTIYLSRYTYRIQVILC